MVTKEIKEVIFRGNVPEQNASLHLGISFAKKFNSRI
jgi:hypothetical protein